MNDHRTTREQSLLNQHAADLQAMGYMDQDGVPVGAGIHLIPLLLETFKAAKRIFEHGVEVMELDVDEEPSTDPNEVIKSFYLAITAATQALQQNGHESPADLAFELIFPHMDWIFCMHYAYWSAQMCPIDVLSVDLYAFDEDNPNGLEDTLRAFLQVSREKEAKWSIKITMKALQQISDSPL